MRASPTTSRGFRTTTPGREPPAARCAPTLSGSDKCEHLSFGDSSIHLIQELLVTNVTEKSADVGVHYPCLAFFQSPFQSLTRRVRRSPRSETMASFQKLPLEYRLNQRPQSFLHHFVPNTG